MVIKKLVNQRRNWNITWQTMLLKRNSRRMTGCLSRLKPDSQGKDNQRYNILQMLLFNLHKDKIQLLLIMIFQPQPLTKKFVVQNPVIMKLIESQSLIICYSATSTLKWTTCSHSGLKLYIMVMFQDQTISS